MQRNCRKVCFRKVGVWGIPDSYSNQPGQPPVWTTRRAKMVNTPHRKHFILASLFAAFFVYFLTISTASAYPIIYEVVRAVSYRAGPGKSYHVLGTLSRGTRVEVHGNEGGWLKIALQNNQFGYSYKSFLTAVGGSSNRRSGYVQRSKQAIKQHVCVFNISNSELQYKVKWHRDCGTVGPYMVRWTPLQGQFF